MARKARAEIAVRSDGGIWLAFLNVGMQIETLCFADVLHSEVLRKIDEAAHVDGKSVASGMGSEPESLEITAIWAITFMKDL
jgi:hypothetical protein